MPSAVELLQSPVVAPKDDELAGINVDQSTLLLNGADFNVQIQNALTDARVDRTIEGASTVTFTLTNQSRSLLESDIFDENATIQLDGMDFSLAQVRKSGNLFTLVFEDAVINALRQFDEPKKMYRDKVTRAEFIYSLVKEARSIYPIEFYAPELHKNQPIAVGKDLDATKRRDRKRMPGFAPSVHLEIKGKKADQKQINLLEEMFQVGWAEDAPYKVMVAAAETVIQESVVDTSKTNGVHIGAFQQDSTSGSVWRKLGGATRDMSKDSKAFFHVATQVYRQNPTLDAYQIAEGTQHSGLPAAYNQWRLEAIDAVRKFGSGASGGGQLSLQRFKRFPFQRGQNGEPETSWEAIIRLADEVQWRAFVSNGVLYYISEVDLFESRPRMLISEDSKGVDWIDWDWDTGKKLATMTIQGRGDRWLAPPGTVVEVEDSGNQANGRWLVQTTTRSLYDAAMTITLKKPMPAKKEPAPDTTSVEVQSRAEGAVHRAATSIGNKKYPYVWGGGHNKGFQPSGNPEKGYDCSGAVSRVLHDAGLLEHPLDSSGFMSWGRPGKGEEFTVYASPNHVFLVIKDFKTKNKKKITVYEHFGTGRWGTSFGGFGQKKEMHPTDGFVARHYPGH